MTRLAINRPVLTFVIFALILLLGGISLSRLPIDFLPDVTLPTITLITPYISASAEDVERNVSEPLEEVLSGVPDVKSIRSLSQEGLSAVFVDFEYGRDLDEATNEIRDQLDQVRSELPEDVEEPIILKFDASQIPVIALTASSKNPQLDLYRLVKDRFTQYLKRAPGVGNITVYSGGREREVTITLDRTKFEQSGLNIDGIASSLAASNINLPVGDVERGRLNLILRVPSEFKNIKEIEQIPVGIRVGEVIRMGDIASVEEEFKDVPNSIRLDGRDVVYFVIQKRSGANTVQVSENILKVINELRIIYPDVEIKKVFDTSDLIETSITNLRNTLIIAGVVVIFISFLLLGNISAGWITAVTLPISIITAFIYLNFSGGSINLVSLSALAITIGIVVDNGIVVLENIFRQRERGRNRKDSAYYGVEEVGQAVLASTLTTVVIFLPFLLVRGFVSIYFREFALSVPVILFASLFTAVTLTPMLASRFLRLRKKEESAVRVTPLQFIPIGVEKIGSRYKNFLRWALSHRWVIVLVAFILFFGSLLLFRFIPTSFMGDSDPGYIDGRIEMPVGTKFEVTDSLVIVIADSIRKFIPETDFILSIAGTSGSGLFGAMGGEVESEATGEIVVIVKEDKERPSEDIAQEINNTLSQLPGVKRLYFRVPQQGGPTGQARDFTLEVYGYEIETTDSIAKIIADTLSRIPGLVGVTVSRQSARPELWLEVDRERAYAYGLTPALIGSYLRSASLGKEATKITSRGDKLDVVIRFEGASDWTELDLESIKIPTPMGSSVPLSNLAKFIPHAGPLSIERKEGERLVKVDADLYGLPLGSADNIARVIIDNMEMPYGIRAQIAGQAEEQAESFKTLFFALIISIVLVFLVMAAQFESFREPFIVMFSIPFAITGVAIAFFITGSTMGIIGFVGIILLVGVVVNNAIVLIDYTNLLRRRGDSIQEAILNAAERRFRPVIMTTLTTVFGLLPLAISKAEGAEMWSPLGIAVIGGLSFSTLITLIFVPVLYSFFETKAELRRLKREPKSKES